MSLPSNNESIKHPYSSRLLDSFNDHVGIKCYNNYHKDNKTFR